MLQHALQELERLTVETAQMEEEEKRTVESVERDSGAERKSVGYKSAPANCLIQSRMRQHGEHLTEST